MFDSKIKTIRAALKIVALEDWSQFTPRDILSLHGVGSVTLDHIRMYLDQHGIRLREDDAPDSWRHNRGLARLGGSLGELDNSLTCPFTVAIDTREQLPYGFRSIRGSQGRPILVSTKRGTLASGDYAIVGLEHLYAIERKSKEDLYGTLTGGRERFDREMERLSALHHADIVVEDSLAGIAIRPPTHTSVVPRSITRSIIAYSQRFPTIHWWTVGDRVSAEQWTFRLLERFFLDHTEFKKQMTRQDTRGETRLDGSVAANPARS